MRNAPSFFVFCACAVAVSGSGVGANAVRVGVFVALTCEDLGVHSRPVLNATVEAAISQATHDARLLRSSVSVEFDVVDACVLEDSVTRLSSALEDSSSSYVAVAGPGLYRLCGVASALQRSRPVCSQLHRRRHPTVTVIILFVIIIIIIIVVIFIIVQFIVQSLFKSSGVLHRSAIKGFKIIQVILRQWDPFVIYAGDSIVPFC